MLEKNQLAWPLALLVITAYAANSQVFVAIGTAAYTSKLFGLWLNHCTNIMFLPLFRSNGMLLVSAEYAHRGKPNWRFLVDTVVVGFFQMEIYYCWFLAAVNIPTQLVAAIFQTSVALVYVLSVIFLDEKWSNLKAAAVLVAVCGVCVVSVVQREPDIEANTKYNYSVGIFYALAAELSKATYQVWFKHAVGAPSLSFSILFGCFASVAHFFPILPLLMVGQACGFEDCKVYIDWSHGQMYLIFVAVTISSAVNMGSLAVIALRNPVFWGSFQLCIIPLSVVFDFVFQGVRPKPLSYVGYALILIAAPILTDSVTGKTEMEKTPIHDSEPDEDPQDGVEMKGVEPMTVGEQTCLGGTA